MFNFVDLYRINIAQSQSQSKSAHGQDSVVICLGVVPHDLSNIPDSKVHGANMGPIWGRQVGPGGPHVDPMLSGIRRSYPGYVEVTSTITAQCLQSKSEEHEAIDQMQGQELMAKHMNLCGEFTGPQWITRTKG